jgi:hypothetical protein
MAIIVSARNEPPNPALISDIYIDESSQTKNRYLVLGGVVANTQSVEAANDCIAKLRLPELPHGEMKWGKVSKGKLKAYGRLAKGFWDNPELRPIHFHSLVVDTHHQDHAAYNQGSREIGFNKEIYQLASKFARLYPTRLFHVYPDQRQTDQLPEDLRLILNRGRRKKGDRRDWPFRRCHFRDSKSTPLLQLVDLLIGAVAYCVNEHAKAPDASESKSKLGAYILRRAGITDCMRSTSISGKFTIWHRELGPRGGRPPGLG